MTNGTAKPIVVKIGGALVDDADALAPFWDSIGQLCETAPVVVVHGGGPQATALARRLGHEPRVVQGRRVTTDLDLNIMLWTLRGAVNARLVAQATQHGLPAPGISSADGGTLRVQKRPPGQIDGEASCRSSPRSALTRMGSFTMSTPTPWHWRWPRRLALCNCCS